jgi:hypothetical protein
MYKKLLIVIVGLTLIIIVGTGIGSSGSPGMFIKIGLGSIVLIVAIIIGLLFFKKTKG